MLITFVAMKQSNMSFNMMTLGGIAASIGLIIDNAIIVVEAMCVKIAAGRPRLAGIQEAIGEILYPLIGSTLTPVVVFIPLAFLTGVPGVFFRALALTMVVSLLVSLVLALTLTPSLAAWFILSLSLAFGLVIMGDNWSSAEARTRRQAWVPAAVLLALTVVCFDANLLDGLWFAAISSVANAVLFGAVVAWYLRDVGRPAQE